MATSPTAAGLFNFGGGVNKNPMGSTPMPNNTGTTFPMGHAMDSGNSTYNANGYNTFNSSSQIPGNPFPQLPTNAFNQLYGGLGPYLSQFINSGAGYNPQVLASLINQIQPQVQRGLATLGSTAGATGNRYGSAYQVGTADYLSQVNQNELGLASNLYENSVQNTLGLLNNIYPLQAQYHNNQGGFLSSLLSSIIPNLGNTGLGNAVGSIPGLGDIFGKGGIFDRGGSGGSNQPTLSIPGGTTPLPGTNENWGGTYNPNQASNPPASGNTGIPGGQISAAAGDSFLNYLNQYFSPSPGSPIGSGASVGYGGQAPTLNTNQTGSIPYDIAQTPYGTGVPFPSGGGGGGTEAGGYDFFDSLDL